MNVLKMLSPCVTEFNIKRLSISLNHWLVSMMSPNKTSPCIHWRHMSTNTSFTVSQCVACVSIILSLQTFMSTSWLSQSGKSPLLYIGNRPFLELGLALDHYGISM